MLARWPDDVAANLEMAHLLLRQGDALRANKVFERAAALAPDHVSVLEARARRAELSDDLALALALYEQVLQKEPARHWIALEKIKLRLALGPFEAAVAELDAFRAERGETPDYFVARIDLFKNVGDFDEAAAAADAGSQMFPQHARLRVKTALLDAELGFFARAREKENERGSHAPLVFAEGMTDLAEWRLDEASRKIEAAHRAQPDDGWILDRLIHTELLRFDLEKAGAHLCELARLNRGTNRLKGVSASPSQTHYGQLFDEFRLDRDACAAARQALTLPGDAKIEALRKIVRDFPDYTPGAIALLIALRQSGAFSRQAPNVEAARIPRTMAQFWDSADLPGDLETYVRSWRLRTPDLAHQRMDENEARAFLREIGRVDALRAFDRAAEPAMKADIFRLGWLHRHGGIYADCDDRCRTDLSPLLSSGHELVLYQEDIGSVGNNFIACAPENPVIGAAFEEAVRAVNQGKTEILWLATGPGLMTRMLGQALAEDGGLEKLSRIKVLDRHEALAYVAIHCAASYKRTERHWSRTAFRPDARRAG
jgi:mannosyltransferase OCH1-like enzyme